MAQDTLDRKTGMEIVTTIGNFPREIQKYHLKPDVKIRVIVNEADEKTASIPSDNDISIERKISAQESENLAPKSVQQTKSNQTRRQGKAIQAILNNKPSIGSRPVVEILREIRDEE